MTRSRRRASPVGQWVFRWLIFLAAVSPLVWIGWALATGGLGDEPVAAVLQLLGQAAIWLLLIVLAMRPLHRWLPRLRLVRYRRMAGLFAAFYALVHAMVWLVADRGLDWAAMVEDVSERLHIGFGMLAFLLLVPLAVTSTRGWMRRLGSGWQELHRLVYPATGLALLHYFLAVAPEVRWPLSLMALFLLLLATRLPR
ncbi:MAG: sulfite oxidase heme-binding subunit YedZ [Pseudomonadota bacterium]